jgi:SAM-dependent methyltransferase
MQRVLEPEWLDTLSPEDSRALRSRRDLRVLNAFMGNTRHIASSLARRQRPGRVMDLGCGDGRVALALARTMQWRDVEFLLVDRVATVSDETIHQFRSVQCRASVLVLDVMEGLKETADVILANLFLHHLNETQVKALLADVAKRCSFFVACEPRRSAWSLFASRCVGLLGCNAITRHDAAVSVRAGFDGKELSALWPSDDRWHLEETSVGAFGHRFIAERQAGS